MFGRLGRGRSHSPVEDDVAALNHYIEAEFESVEIGTFSGRAAVDGSYRDAAEGLKLPAEEMAQKAEIFRHMWVIRRHSEGQVAAVSL